MLKYICGMVLYDRVEHVVRRYCVPGSNDSREHFIDMFVEHELAA